MTCQCGNCSDSPEPSKPPPPSPPNSGRPGERANGAVWSLHPTARPKSTNREGVRRDMVSSLGDWVEPEPPRGRATRDTTTTVTSLVPHPECLTGHQREESANRN